jgi:hypothetical protein
MKKVESFWMRVESEAKLGAGFHPVPGFLGFSPNRAVGFPRPTRQRLAASLRKVRVLRTAPTVLFENDGSRRSSYSR